MSNLIRKVLLIGAVAIGVISAGQAAQASAFDVLDEFDVSFEIGDYDYDDEWDWDDEYDDEDDDYGYEDEDDDSEDDEEE